MNQKLKAVPSPREADRRRLLVEHSSTDILKATQTDELVIVLCGPMGTPLRDVAVDLKESLRTAFGYEVEIVHVSDFIRQFSRREGCGDPSGPAEKRSTLIQCGGEMRRRFGTEVLAELAVQQIRTSGELNGRDPVSREFVSRRVCHIVQSVKKPQELELLRTVAVCDHLPLSCLCASSCSGRHQGKLFHRALQEELGDQTAWGCAVRVRGRNRQSAADPFRWRRTESVYEFLQDGRERPETRRQGHPDLARFSFAALAQEPQGASCT